LLFEEPLGVFCPVHSRSEALCFIALLGKKGGDEMAYKRKTLRAMPPKTRKLARLINELDSTVRKLKNTLPDIADAEIAERAMFNQIRAAKPLPAEETGDEEDTSALLGLPPEDKHRVERQDKLE